MEFATKTIHAGQPSEPETGSLIAPIFQTSTYEQDAPGCHKGFDYSRTNNPTRARLEAVLSDLEGVEHAAVFASGLAAENAILQAYLKPGDEIVIPLDVYGGTYRILNKVYEPAGAMIRQIDFAQPGALHGRPRGDRQHLCDTALPAAVHAWRRPGRPQCDEVPRRAFGPDPGSCA